MADQNGITTKEMKLANMFVSYLHGERTTYFDEKNVVYEGETHLVPIIRFHPYAGMDWLEHGFSTRLGGVSEGIYQSMNLSFSQGDNSDNVTKNHYIMGKALGVKPENMVYSYQTHTTNVIKVTREHAGMGITRERSYGNVDGFVTDQPGLLLITSYADCVPLYFADVHKRVIGLSHSGWRGTVGNMAQATVDAMKREYRCAPQDIVAFIGPSICKSCYEVGEDVAAEFYAAYPDAGAVGILSPKPENTEPKYVLDLHAANRVNMERAGILPENIYVTDLCTCCNPQLLFSHRASKGRRGGLCGYMMIKPE